MLRKKDQARDIKSFVRRDSRLTTGQARAIEQYWQHFGLAATDSATYVARLVNAGSPIVLEIGFGNGDSLFFQAQAYPHYQFIGIEVYQTGVGRLFSCAGMATLTNLKVICDDAVMVLEKGFPVEAFDVIQIHFPDPWPKKRHHKRRLIQINFLKQLWALLKPNGQIRIATDWQPYAEHIETVIAKSDMFFSSLTLSEAVSSFDLVRPKTKFEEKGLAAGRVIHEFMLRKKLAKEVEV